MLYFIAYLLFISVFIKRIDSPLKGSDILKWKGENYMYRIGEFSILQNVTIKTLRYYDEIGLFKPAVTDSYTGYRYYSDQQMKDFQRISYYKDLGFSLEEIKKMRESSHPDDYLANKRNQLISEIQEKERQLQQINHMIEKPKRIEFRPYQESAIVAKRVTLKKKENFFTEVEKVKEEIIKLGYTPIYRTVSNLEVGYVEEDIDTFVGYTVAEKKRIVPDGDLIFLGFSKAPKMLVGHGTTHEVSSLYQDMVQYAHENQIQIRGFFTAIFQNEEIEMYVEAFDLKEENEDYIHHLEHFHKDTTLDPSLVGTYQIREILPDIKHMFQKEKQKSMLDTRFAILELHRDGSTNFQDMEWNQSDLIFTYQGQEIPLPLRKTEIDGKEYLEVLMNESYEFHKSQRPMEYLYEKIK